MLKILAGFMSGVPIGMIVMALLTMGKTSDLYSTIEACNIARGGAK